MSTCEKEILGPYPDYDEEAVARMAYMQRNASNNGCMCGMSECMCNAGNALIGPAETFGDGTVYVFWTHPEPSAELARVISEFGTPGILDTSPGGLGRWGARLLTGTPFTEIVIKDEAILHCCPAPHLDYLYASVRIQLSPENQAAMLKLSKSVWYDRLTHTLTARCHFMGAVVATLLLVTQMELGIVQAEKAPGVYGPTIMASKDPAMYRGMFNELAHNVIVLESPGYPNCDSVSC
jgi:hypothetical protein